MKIEKFVFQKGFKKKKFIQKGVKKWQKCSLNKCTVQKTGNLKIAIF